MDHGVLRSRTGIDLLHVVNMDDVLLFRQNDALLRVDRTGRGDLGDVLGLKDAILEVGGSHKLLAHVEGVAQQVQMLAFHPGNIRHIRVLVADGVVVNDLHLGGPGLIHHLQPVEVHVSLGFLQLDRCRGLGLAAVQLIAVDLRTLAGRRIDAVQVIGAGVLVLIHGQAVFRHGLGVLAVHDLLDDGAVMIAEDDLHRGAGVNGLGIDQCDHVVAVLAHGDAGVGSALTRDKREAVLGIRAGDRGGDLLGIEVAQLHSVRRLGVDQHRLFRAGGGIDDGLIGLVDGLHHHGSPLAQLIQGLPVVDVVLAVRAPQGDTQRLSVRLVDPEAVLFLQFRLKELAGLASYGFVLILDGTHKPDPDRSHSSDRSRSDGSRSHPRSPARRCESHSRS